MNRLSRRTLLKTAMLFMVSGPKLFSAAKDEMVMTVRGGIPASEIGQTLPHEHVLVDFIGAAGYDPKRWDKDKVIAKMLPYLQEVRALGCKTLVDCTPNYLGRDVLLLKELSTLSGLNIVTNTGYYGGSDEKFLAAHVFEESEQQLADRWIAEWTDGIDGTDVKPGFIKISVNGGTLSKMSRKLIGAAAITHLRTGLVIASHTGPEVPAVEQLEVLKSHGIAPDAFIWVHAQHERAHIEKLSGFALRGGWVSIDGLDDKNVPEYVAMLEHFREKGCLGRILVSHDAGFYDPAKPDGGAIRGYSVFFEKLVPVLREKVFAEADIRKLASENSQEAFGIKVMRI